MISFHFQNPNNNITDQLLKFRIAIVEEFSAQACATCGLTAANIKNDEFSCRGGLTNQIVYRAMIIGTDVYSAPGLVSLMESWVASGTASISALSLRLHLDSNCRTSLDTLNEPDCFLEVETTTTTDTSTTTTVTSDEVITTTPEVKDQGPDVKLTVARSVRSGEIGGFVVGAIIVILLVAIIIVITAVAIRRFKSKTKYVNINTKLLDFQAQHYIHNLIPRPLPGTRLPHA